MARVAQRDWTQVIVGAPTDTLRVVTQQVRNSMTLKGMAKRRARATLFNDPCAACGLPACFNVGMTEPARAEFAHIVSLRAWGTSQPVNIVVMHKHCNAEQDKAGILDARPWIAPGRAWKSKDDCLAWERTPWRTHMTQNLPTIEDMDRARAEVQNDDGSVGLPW